MTNEEAYIQGFAEKCASRGLSQEQFEHLAKQAGWVIPEVSDYLPERRTTSKPNFGNWSLPSTGNSGAVGGPVSWARAALNKPTAGSATGVGAALAGVPPKGAPDPAMDTNNPYASRWAPSKPSGWGNSELEEDSESGSLNWDQGFRGSAGAALSGSGIGAALAGMPKVEPPDPTVDTNDSADAPWTPAVQNW